MIGVRKVVQAICLILVLLPLTSCQEQISDEELQQELEQLSEEELNAAIEAMETENGSALAGQAYGRKRVSKNKFLTTAYRVRISNSRLKEICTDGKDNDKDKLIDCEDPDCCKGVCVNVNGRCRDISNSQDWANKFQGSVYKENKVLDIVELHGLTNDGTLTTDGIRVINHCLTKENVKSQNKIFIYDPISERIEFDQVNAYYYGYETIEFYKQFADFLGWEEELNNGVIKLEVPILTIKLCDSELGPDGEEWKGGTFYGDSQTLALACYDKDTCASIGKYSDKFPPGDGFLSLSLFIHEYTHGRYVPIIKKNGVGYKDSGEWWYLNEAYASFIPRMYFSSGSVSEYGDLDNNYKYGKEYYECSYQVISLKCQAEEGQPCTNERVQGLIQGCKSNHDISSIGGALWDFSEKIGDKKLSAELVISSWKYLHKFDNYHAPSPSVAMVALIEASKEKYGNTYKHKQTKEKIKAAFYNHITPNVIISEI